MTDDLDVVASEEAAPVAPAEPVSTPDPGARNALVAFGLVALLALGFYLFAGRHMWFWFDEFDFLSARGMNLHDIFGQHGGHLVALPVIVYRALYATVGMRSYVPYQLLSITAHLVAAGLLRVVMRRAGVGPWIATLAASVYVLFGTGQQDILWAFQITFTGALVFGLAQLLLADHDGPIDRRDWWGLGAGLLALACSGVGVAMVAAVGLAALIRRGWRAALFHVLPLGLLYVIWQHGNTQRPQFVPKDQWRTLVTWDHRSLGATFDGFAQVPFLGWLLIAVMVGGGVLAWFQWEPEARRARASLTVATLFGGVFFTTVTGASRYFFPQAATSSRYVDITAALMLPAIAVGADALWRRSRALGAVALIALAVGIPGNVAAASDATPKAAYFGAYQQMIRSLPRSSLAHEVPASLEPEPNQAPELTVGWLLGAARSGKLPAPRPSTPTELATNRLRLSLESRSGSAGSCRPVLRPEKVVLQRGDRFSVRGVVGVKLIDGGVTSARLPYGASFLTGSGEHLLVAVAGPIRLLVSAQTSALPSELCGLPRPQTTSGT